MKIMGFLGFGIESIYNFVLLASKWYHDFPNV